MPTRNVVLTERQAALLEDLVACGRYQNASEVLREGLRLIEKREIEDALRLDALQSAVRVGQADSAAGKFKTFDSSKTLREHLKALASEAIASA